MDKWLLCVVALVLGMLIANMMKSVCGCKSTVVEGADAGRRDRAAAGCCKIANPSDNKKDKYENGVLPGWIGGFKKSLPGNGDISKLDMLYNTQLFKVNKSYIDQIYRKKENKPMDQYYEDEMGVSDYRVRSDLNGYIDQLVV